MAGKKIVVTQKFVEKEVVIPQKKEKLVKMNLSFPYSDKLAEYKHNKSSGSGKPIVFYPRHRF